MNSIHIPTTSYKTKDGIHEAAYRQCDFVKKKYPMYQTTFSAWSYTQWNNSVKN